MGLGAGLQGFKIPTHHLVAVTRGQGAELLTASVSSSQMGVIHLPERVVLRIK